MSLCSPAVNKGSGKYFVGTYEAEIFASQQNTQVRAQRMQQIRKQESDLTKKKIQIQKEEQQQQMEKEQMELKYKQYLEKKAQIEALQQAREQTLIEQQRAAREAEEYRQSQIQQQEYKLKMQAYYEEQAQLRFQEAQEWKKQTFLETSQGKAIQIVNQRKEASLLEKQREAQSVAIYKEQSKNRTQSTFTQDLENYEKFDKNVSRRQILKPEDFANTCFHNPQVVKNQEIEKENAMEKANTTMIENQTMLLEQARLKREQERIQKQRSIKAISKERQLKVLEQLEQEAKFIKKQEVIQLQKQKPPTRKPNSRVNHQKLLSNEFDKIFACNNSTIEVRDHRIKSNSPNKKKSSIQDKQRPKSVKIFTKAPLDSNLFNEKESMQKEDYTKYAMGSEEQNTSQKKRVQFSDAKETELNPDFRESGVTVKVTDRTQNQKPTGSIDTSNTQQIYTEENEEIDENEEQNQLSSQHEEVDEEEIDSPPQLKSNQVQDIRQYIQEQEKYLQKLEQQRINTSMKIKNEEQQLVQSFQKTRQQQFAKQVIPEESEDESSYQQSPSQLQNSDLQQQQSIQSVSQQQFQSSPESQQLQISAQFEIDDNFDSHDIMQQFLKPKKAQVISNNQKLTLIADPQSSQKQTLSNQQPYSQQNTIQQMFSPNSDLNYSLSEVKNTKTSPIKRYDFQQMPSTQQQEESSLKKESIDSEQLKYSLQESPDKQEEPHENEETLGEIFQKRKAMLAKKLEQRQEVKTVEKNGKTKEELIQIRKEMLKSKRQQQKEIQKNEEEVSDEELKPVEADDKRSQLMKRLAMGEKVKIDKKEMIGLTNKNYEQLPEVKKKKDEQEKNESLKQRKQKVKEMDQKLRETMKQKRSH